MFVSSAAAKKVASSHSESSGEKGLKEGINGEMEEETNGKAKEGQEVASGSKSRVCQRQEASEASGQGELTVTVSIATLRFKTELALKTMNIIQHSFIVL